MKTLIVAKQITVTDDLKSIIEKKLEKFDKFFNGFSVLGGKRAGFIDRRFGNRLLSRDVYCIYACGKGQLVETDSAEGVLRNLADKL